jgi:hypothetical protein
VRSDLSDVASCANTEAAARIKQNTGFIACSPQKLIPSIAVAWLGLVAG